MRTRLIAAIFLLFLGVSVSAGSFAAVPSPLGDLSVSCTIVDSDSFSFDGLKDGQFVSKKHGFSIALPSGRNWQIIESPKIPGLLRDVPIFFLNTEIIDGFRANVNVLVEPVNKDVTIAAYMEGSAFALRNAGKTIITSRTDEATSCGYIESVGVEQNVELSTIQRLGIWKGNAFIVTATSLAGDKTPARIKKSLGEILNSFKLLR